MLVYIPAAQPHWATAADEAQVKTCCLSREAEMHHYLINRVRVNPNPNPNSNCNPNPNPSQLLFQIYQTLKAVFALRNQISEIEQSQNDIDDEKTAHFAV